MDPTLPNPTPGTLSGSVISYTKRALAVSNNDINYAILESSTLDNIPGSWTEVNPYLINNSTTISYMLPVGQPKEFVRLRVTRN
jgi:hypothetical protein